MLQAQTKSGKAVNVAVSGIASMILVSLFSSVSWAQTFQCQGRQLVPISGTPVTGQITIEIDNPKITWNPGAAQDPDQARVLLGPDRLCGVDISSSTCEMKDLSNSLTRSASTHCSSASGNPGSGQGSYVYSLNGRNGRVSCAAWEDSSIRTTIEFSQCEEKSN